MRPGVTCLPRAVDLDRAGGRREALADGGDLAAHHEHVGVLEQALRPAGPDRRAAHEHRTAARARGRGGQGTVRRGRSSRRHFESLPAPRGAALRRLPPRRRSRLDAYRLACRRVRHHAAFRRPPAGDVAAGIAPLPAARPELPARSVHAASGRGSLFFAARRASTRAPCTCSFQPGAPGAPGAEPLSSPPRTRSTSSRLRSRTSYRSPSTQTSRRASPRRRGRHPSP